jgi:hypothetical protein
MRVALQGQEALPTLQRQQQHLIRMRVALQGQEAPPLQS